MVYILSTVICIIYSVSSFDSEIQYLFMKCQKNEKIAPKLITVVNRLIQGSIDRHTRMPIHRQFQQRKSTSKRNEYGLEWLERMANWRRNEDSRTTGKFILKFFWISKRKNQNLIRKWIPFILCPSLWFFKSGFKLNYWMIWILGLSSWKFQKYRSFTESRFSKRELQF